jgi:hypothetical protein
VNGQELVTDENNIEATKARKKDYNKTLQE